MQKKRMLAKYNICDFHFVHDLDSIIFSNALSYMLPPYTSQYVCLVSLWTETNNFLLLVFLYPVTAFENWEFYSD